MFIVYILSFYYLSSLITAYCKTPSCITLRNMNEEAPFFVRQSANCLLFSCH